MIINPVVTSKLVVDPILEPVYKEIEEARKKIEEMYHDIEYKLGLDDMKDFSKKSDIVSERSRFSDH